MLQLQRSRLDLHAAHGVPEPLPGNCFPDHNLEEGLCDLVSVFWIYICLLSKSHALHSSLQEVMFQFEGNCYETTITKIEKSLLSERFLYFVISISTKNRLLIFFVYLDFQWPFVITSRAN